MCIRIVKSTSAPTKLSKAFFTESCFEMLTLVKSEFCFKSRLSNIVSDPLVLAVMERVAVKAAVDLALLNTMVVEEVSIPTEATIN